MDRLNSLSQLPEGIAAPAYDPAAQGCGIVHLGLGAFQRAHIATYSDAAMSASGGDWRTIGVSLRSPTVAEQLNPQNGLYAIRIEQAAPETRVIGALATVLVAPDNPEAVLEAMAAPETRIVTITVTEKAYGLNKLTGGLDRGHPAIAADLAGEPARPTGVVGYIVAALARRREGAGPLTVLSCDNLTENGHVLKRLVLEFARERDAELADWIEANIPFPCTMVDRITPATTQATIDAVAADLGVLDLGCVATEPFTQWVIEDDFCKGRPDWEAGGAIFASDVRPYEKMKLRLLNGAHSMIAYLGQVAGLEYVRDVMAVPELAALVRRHMETAAQSLDPVPGISIPDYIDELCERFANPAIAHRTLQIAMDGTEKLPPRLLEAATELVAAGKDWRTYAFAVASWMAFVRQAATIDDPREAELLSTKGNLFALDGLWPDALAASTQWTEAVKAALESIESVGPVRAAEALA
jgi:fructuronate reductase